MASPSASVSTSLLGLVVVSLLVAGLLGCESETKPPSYVARVGDHYLTQSEFNRMLDGMGPVPDSTQARQQVIQQWIRRTLLLREAERLNLEEDPEVQRQLQERRKSTLVTAMTDRLYEKARIEPSDEEVRTYFERHEDKLALREPYVRVRHLATSSQDSALSARQRLRRAPETEVDTVWARLAQAYARTPQRALELSDRFLPQGRLFAQLPYVQDELSNLQEGEVAPILEDNDQFHVLQLVRRIPEGTSPKLRWMEPEIRRRLRIRNRKQMYAREVQRLRNKAKANDLIDTP
jgi:parvulin-like peptidyl-prolyl isomerase